MTTENGTPSLQPDAEAWLDGLAGRDGTSEAARDGARLRAALPPSVDEAAKASAPSWHRIALAARQPEVSAPVRHRRESANNGQWRRFAGGSVVMLALVLGAGVWTMTSRDGDMPGRMRGAPSAAGAVWRANNPTQAASELAARLEAAGARVTVAPNGPGALVSVECAPVACAAVTELVAPLDTAVDANGRLSLQVLPKL